MTRTIVITGASSGIGAALALHYADQRPHLALLGRDAGRLERISAQCRTRGATVETAVLDVREREKVKAWIAEFDARTPIDMLIANAGVMEGTPPGGDIEPPDAAYHLMETNVLGVLNVVQPLALLLMQRGRGQIAIVSSIAAFTPLADSPSYCASKAAVLSYGLSLRALLAPRDIKINVVCPGYIETPMMLRERGPKPFKMTAERAAEIIARGLERDRATIMFPFFFAWVTWLSGLLPDGLRRWTSRSFRFTVGD